MIEINNLRKTFGRFVAVDSVSLLAEKGEIFGLLGPNGAGKTTTLRMISGILKPSSGTLQVNGIDVIKHPTAVKAQLGVLPDGGSLYKRLTARENIAYFGALHGMSSSEITRAIDYLNDILSMEEIIDRLTAGFSQGERMKVCLARALIHDPAYVLLDEPTNGLDVPTTRAVRQLLSDLKARGKCIIFSSHLMYEVSNLCDRIAIVAHGHVVTSGTIENIIERSPGNNLEDAFVHFAYPKANTKQEALN